jgi:1,4-dihydroxy-2-naphthoyl-CoA synthase
LELAATMATKSPLAIAVIKEQLRVLSDYQPIAAQVYERVQGLRRQAYDSSDYLEGLEAFAQKRQPACRAAWHTAAVLRFSCEPMRRHSRKRELTLKARRERAG